MEQIYKYFFLLSLVFLASCKEGGEKNNYPKEWGAIFEKYGVNGTFILYDLSSGQSKYYNEQRADSLYIPTSTFKVLNSLISLETNAVSNENEIIEWDGSDKGWGGWNKDQDMKSAISVSCVWFYQELAKRIGKKQMQEWLNYVDYGNKAMGGKIDNFWLEGDLRISAKQQIVFLKRLVNNELPFKIKNQEIVKKILITDTKENYVIRSKTGWGMRIEPQIGWFIGYVEKKDNKWIFAMNIDILKKTDSKLRKKIIYDILRTEKIIQ